MKKIILSLCCLSGLLTADAQKSPAWLSKAVVFQIYPSSYMDSDGNGTGDLKGITSRLDYIKSIGVNTVWVNPVFETKFKDGGYDITDFYKVDPRFGTNADFINLAKEAHHRGMHVIVDLVAGHASNESMWFKKSMEAGKNEYSDYFIWSSFRPKDLPPADTLKFVELNAPRNKYYLKNYYDAQPALNYGYLHPNPAHPWEQAMDAPGPMAVRNEMKKVISYWMDNGIDGFRVDLASSLVKGDPDKLGSIAVWQDINAWFDQKYPQGIMVSQWSNPKQAVAQAGFDVDFFLRPGKLTAQAVEGGRAVEGGKVFFDRKGEGSVGEWERYFTEQYNSTLGKGFVSLQTGSHGVSRLQSDLRKEPADMKVMLTFVLTQPGVPMVYYGDEIGMKFLVGEPEIDGSRNRSGSRTPMQWDGSPNAGFTTAASDKIYLPIDPDPNRPTMAAQDKDPSSQLNYVRALLKLRASSPALNNEGRLTFVSDTLQAYPLVYLRYSGNEKYIVAINPSNKPVDAKINSQGAAKAKYALGTGGSSENMKYTTNQSGDMISLPAVSAAIFKLDN